MPKITRINKTGDITSEEGFTWQSMAESVGQTKASRYRRSDFYVDEERGAIYRETYSKSFVSMRGMKYFKITPGYEYRPDLLSKDFYGNSKYWWIILEANGLTGIEQFTRGMTIVVPHSEEVLPGV
jgi:hypothetical protein